MAITAVVAKSGCSKGSWEADAATEAVVVVGCNVCFVCFHESMLP